MTHRWLRPLTVAALVVVVPLAAATPSAGQSRPTIHKETVTPDTGLVNGQRVKVHSQHYKPHAVVAVSMCRVKISTYNDCDSSTTTYVKADSSGSWTLKYSVKKYLHLGDGTKLTCNSSGNCTIGAASPIPTPTDASKARVYFKK
jgi:hypothetical protein